LPQTGAGGSETFCALSPGKPRNVNQGLTFSIHIRLTGNGESIVA
jgi:hypothetical protein